jgi:pilus assembly protein CpaB
MPRKLIGVVASVVLAALGTLILVAFVRGAESRALAGEQTVDVLVVTETIDRNTPASEIADRIATEQVPVKVRAEGVVDDLSDIEGRVTSVELVPGEQVMASRFVTPAQLVQASQVDIPEGLQEVTISLEPQRAVGGQIAPGDTVGLVTSLRPEDADAADTTKMILHKILVTNVQIEQLPSQPDEGDPDVTGADTPDLAPTGNLLITMAVDVPRVERIVFSAEHGSIWLTAEPESASEDGSQVRDGGNIYDD